jgi:hypothetical protein
VRTPKGPHAGPLCQARPSASVTAEQQAAVFRVPRPTCLHCRPAGQKDGGERGGPGLLGSLGAGPQCASLMLAFVVLRLVLGRDGFYKALPMQEDMNNWPERICDKCGEPMPLLGTLRPVGFRPATAIFKCNECRFSVSEPIDPAPAIAPQ